MRAARWLVSALCALGACGGADDGGVPEGGGEVQGQWESGYCVATFTQDYTFIDPFGDAEFRAKQGGRYLIGGFGDFGAEATVLYLAEKGPIELSVDVESGAALPFSSNCAPDAVEERVGVFRQVAVYSDQAMSALSCMLTKGSSFDGGGLSYGLVDGDLFAGGGTYEVSFAGLPGVCAGLSTGYVAASSAKLGTTQYTVIPLASVVAPRP